MRVQFVAIPFAFAVAGGVVGPASAQPEAAAPQVVTSGADGAKVEQLFRAGVKAHQEKDYLKAYDSYMAAWRLEKAYAIAGNLGKVELMMGKHRDAAEHLAYALRVGVAEPKPEVRARMEKDFASAQAKVLTVRVHVNRPGTELLVDGNVVARAPLADPIFVEPGSHSIAARFGQQTVGTTPIDGRAGESRDVSLVIADPSPVAPPESAASTSGGLAPPPPPTERPSVPPPSDGHAAGGARLQAWPVIVGGSVAAVGLAAGLVAVAKANSDTGSRDDILAGLGGVARCGGSSPYGGPCARANDLNGDIASDKNLAVAGFAVFGIAAAATLTYVLWPRDTRARSAGFALSPTFSGNQVGLVLQSGM